MFDTVMVGHPVDFNPAEVSAAWLIDLNIPEKGDDYFKEIMSKKYEDLDDHQRTFYTMVLILAEIERKAVESNAFNEKEILEPGDEGYVEPTAG